jgi:hypothetical protein
VTNSIATKRVLRIPCPLWLLFLQPNASDAE